MQNLGVGEEGANEVHYGKCGSGVQSVFTHVTSMQMYWNERNRWHKKRVPLPQDWFGTPTWPPFHCFGTLIWLWNHVKAPIPYVNGSCGHLFANDLGTV